MKKTINWKSVVAHRRPAAPEPKAVKAEAQTVKPRARAHSDREGDALDGVVHDIEKDTICSEGFGREVGKLGMDLALLAGFADPDEMENEERICRHSEHASKHTDDVADGEVEAFLEGRPSGGHDFRDDIRLHDPRRPAHRLKLKTHSECRADEVYLLNVSRKGFDIIRWETKRMGDMTSCGCYPVFVQRSELLAAGYRLLKPKQPKVKQVA